MVVWCTGIARAQDQPAGSADELSERGYELYQARRYKEAASAFRQAYKVEAKPKFLFAWGQAERQAGNCRVALTLYRKYLDSRPDADSREATDQVIAICEEELRREAGGGSERQSSQDPADQDPGDEAGEGAESEAGEGREGRTDRERKARERKARERKARERKARERRQRARGRDRQERDRDDERSDDSARRRDRDEGGSDERGSDAGAGDRWYDDKTTLGLAIGGGVALVLGTGLYLSARSIANGADEAEDHQGVEQEINRAQGRRNVAVVMGLAGGALITVAVLRVRKHRNQERSAILTAPLLTPELAGVYFELSF